MYKVCGTKIPENFTVKRLRTKITFHFFACIITILGGIALQQALISLSYASAIIWTDCLYIPHNHMSQQWVACKLMANNLGGGGGGGGGGGDMVSVLGPPWFLT